MSGLIKSGAAGFGARVRPLAFDEVGTTRTPAADPVLVALRERVLDLEAQLAEHEAAAVELRKAAEEALAEGEAAGREAGRAEADERRAEALALLGETAEGAVAALDARLEATDRLAALLASTCLETLFGAPGPRAELVRDLIRQQLDRLRQETIVEIQVSAEDFASTEEAAAAAPACAVSVSDALASGDCTIRLKLGELDIGLGQQWGTLRSALEEMA